MAIRLQPPVGNAQNQFGLENTTEIDAVDHPPHGRDDLIGKLDLANSQRPATARQAEPAEEKAAQLPQSIKTEAARHDRIALKMAAEEPEVRFDGAFRAQEALAI